jgi:multidrug efflux pump subunit AcrB
VGLLNGWRMAQPHHLRLTRSWWWRRSPAFATVATPREEEPQIIVPMIDVFVQMPGASAKEVEERVTIPLEKKLMEIPGVEYVYSISSPGLGFAIVRFKVGEDEEKSIVKLYNKMYANFDLIPPGATTPLIKPRSIDDVPILALTLWSDRVDGYTLRRIAAQLDDQIKDVTDVSETRLIGGERRQVRILLDPARLAAYRLAPATVAGALTATNREVRAGSFSRDNREILVDTARFLERAEDVGRVVVGAADGRPVYLRDVAQIVDGPEEPRPRPLRRQSARRPHCRGGARRSGRTPRRHDLRHKRKGTNAIVIATMSSAGRVTGVFSSRARSTSPSPELRETAQEKPTNS